MLEFKNISRAHLSMNVKYGIIVAMPHCLNAPRPECPKPSRNAPTAKSQCPTFGRNAPVILLLS